MASLSDLYNQARLSGNTGAADYYAQALYAAANPGASIQGVTAAPLTGAAGILPSGSLVPSNNIFGAIGNSLPTLSDLFSLISKYDPTTGTALDPMAGSGTNPIKLGQSASDLTDSAEGAIGFLSDIPRVVTSVIGLILIVAGIFALSRGPAVQVVGGHIKDALTS